MNHPNDPDDLMLREMFLQQRTEDHAAAPDWSARFLRAPATTRRPKPVWLWPTAAATACTLLALPFIMKSAPPRTDLSSLPPLMPLVTEPSAPLLRDTSFDLALTNSASPTDFLLPIHLTIQIL
jgi:hypothetical protein